MAILKDMRQNWLMKKVNQSWISRVHEHGLENDHESGMHEYYSEQALKSWMNGHTREEFIESLGLIFDTLDKNTRRLTDIYEKVVVEYENKNGEKINKNGVAIKPKVIHRIEHKPSDSVYEQRLYLFSNGLITSGHSWSTSINGYQGSGSPTSIPWHTHNKLTTENYAEDILKVRQFAVDWVEEKFANKPKVMQRLIDSIDEQMDHNRFGGLHWMN